MFVQHHLTLDSAEHRNSDSRSRRSGDRRTSSIPREPIPSLSERKEWELRELSKCADGEPGGPGVSGYARCQILRAMSRALILRHGRRRFSSSFCAPLSCLSFFFYLSLLTLLLPPFLSVSPLSTGVKRNLNRKSCTSLVLAREYKCKRERAANPTGKGMEPNLGAESNTRETKRAKRVLGGPRASVLVVHLGFIASA